MGTYCRDHLKVAIDKYLNDSTDGKITILKMEDRHICQHGHCEANSEYKITYIPKTQEQREKEVICKMCNTIPCMCASNPFNDR